MVYMMVLTIRIDHICRSKEHFAWGDAILQSRWHERMEPGERSLLEQLTRTKQAIAMKLSDDRCEWKHMGKPREPTW